MTAEWIRWSWVYGSLQVEEFETLEEALAETWFRQDDESFHCIEGPDGVLPREVVEADQARRRDEERSRASAQTPPTWGVRLRDPDGDRSGWWETFTNRADADAEAARLRPRFGDRVTVAPIPLPIGYR